MTDSDSTPEGNSSSSSSIHIPKDQLARVHDVHRQISRHPKRTALWRTLERGLDELERKLDSNEE